MLEVAAAPGPGEPSAVHLHRGTRAVQRMVEFAPSTGGLALWVRHRDLADEPAPAGAVPPAFTDGRTICYGREFEALTVALQCGWVAHEVLHVALRHAQRFLALQQRLGDADLELFNVCADAIVNGTLGHLGWLRLPAGAVQLDRLLRVALDREQTVEAALLEWDVERLYREIDDRRVPAHGGGREDGPRAARVRALGRGGGRAACADLRPDARTAGAPQDEAEAAREWRERLLRAHAGDAAHSMLRTLVADLPRTRTPWEQVLRAQLAHALAHRPGPSWSRPARSYLANQGRAGPHRRMPWEPGTSATRPVPRLAVVVDVSGSIDDALLRRFAAEVEAITRRLEAALVIVVGDDRVRRVAHFEPGCSDLREVAFDGGGGTDFTPLLEEAGRHRPDIAVVLTDLQGPARVRPRCPVVWAVPEAAGVDDLTPPFGRLLVLR
jgi:hypothetical protein